MPPTPSSAHPWLMPKVYNCQIPFVGGGDEGGLGAITPATLETKALPFDKQHLHPMSGDGHPSLKGKLCNS